MMSILGFLIILLPLVIVHELGHFLFAKLFNVKAEVFSIGFGPKLFTRKWGETDFCFSAIPFGGYVKLLGEDRDAPLPPEEAKRALHNQEAYKRFFIFLGGPLFNFLYAILVFMAILLIGEPHYASVIGRVVPGSPAEKAGFLGGDRIVEINGAAVNLFEQVGTKISESPKTELLFKVKRGEAHQEIRVTPATEDGFSMYGETTRVGEIEGLLPMARTLVAGVSGTKSPAFLSGVRTGDSVESINGKKVETWEQLESEFRGLSDRATVAIGVAPASGAKKTVSFTKKAGATLAALSGLHSSELFVEKAVEGSPAEKTGIQAGDRIAKVDGIELQSFYHLRDLVQKGGEKSGQVVVSVERPSESKQLDITITPNAKTSKDALLNRVTEYTIGVVPKLTFVEPETVLEREFNPFLLLYKGTQKMVSFTARNFVSVGKMFTGDVSVKTLGGPIMIGKIAGESMTRGIHAFLTTMAILSIGLGVLNILPVPVLDGGHLVLLGIEMIRGKPLSLRQMEVVQQVGLTLILLLMATVLVNDFSRLPLFQ